MGSAILFGGALAAKKITDDNMTSLIDSVITAQTSNQSLTPAQEWVARVANPESAIKFLSDTLIRYQKEVTGNLSDSQLVTLFPGLGSGFTTLPVDLGKMSATIKKAAKSPGSIYDLVGNYIRSSNEKAATVGPGESPDTSAAEQALKAGAAVLARDAAAIKAELDAISALAVKQTPLIVTKNLIPLQKNIVVLTTYAARALQFNKNDIAAKQLDFNPVSAALSSTKTTMIKDYSRSFKLADYPPELRNNILPSTVDDYVQLAGGDKALLPLAAHSIIQMSQGFSDDPVALTGLGMGVLKAHATEFGYDFTGDDISISTLQAIGRATDTAVVNFNEAWKNSYTFGEASAEAVGAGPAQSTSR